MKTRRGNTMCAVKRKRILEVMTEPENDGKVQREISKLAGVSVRTLQDYLTDEVWEEIRETRLEVMAENLSNIDRAIFARAMKGDLAAAKLIYSRWEEKRIADTCERDNLSLEEIDERLSKIREEIGKFKET